MLHIFYSSIFTRWATIYPNFILVFLQSAVTTLELQYNSLILEAAGSGTPRPKTISARTFRPIFQSGTARPTLVGPLGPIFFGGGGGGGVGWDLVFYSVYVHQNNIQETLFNVIIIFRQGNTEII